MGRKKTGFVGMTVRLPPALKKSVEELAKRKTLDVSDIGRMAIQAYVDRMKEEKKP